jgi:T5orf172 domain
MRLGSNLRATKVNYSCMRNPSILGVRVFAETRNLLSGIRGWVYVITNSSLPDLVKIGFSTKDPRLRARKLKNTGVPAPYIVERDFLVVSPYEVEQRAHEILEGKREGKEWFRCSVGEACAIIKRIASDPEFRCPPEGTRLPPLDMSRDSPAADPAQAAAADSAASPKSKTTADHPAPSDFAGCGARWKLMRRTGQLVDKISGLTIGRDEYRYDASGTIKGFETRLRDKPWIAIAEVEWVA